MYDQSFNVKSECVALAKCPEALDSPTAPYENLPCGFDTDLSQLKICCPTQSVTEPQVSVSISELFRSTSIIRTWPSLRGSPPGQERRGQ